jgi:hypothetical protein
MNDLEKKNTQKLEIIPKPEIFLSLDMFLGNFKVKKPKWNSPYQTESYDTKIDHFDSKK